MATTVRIVYDVDDSELRQATQAVDALNQANEEASRSTKELGDESEDAAKGMDSFGDEVKNAANNINVFGIGLGDAAGRLGDVTKSTNAFSTALKAIPILAVVAALTSLVSFLTKTKRGQDELRVSTARLSAAFAEVRDTASNAGERVFRDLAKRAELLLFVFNGLTKAIKGTNASLAEEARIAGILEQRLILTEDAERNLRVERAKGNVVIEEQKLIAEDVTLGFAEREAAAQKALETETRLLNEEIKIGERFVQILKEQQALGENTVEDLEELAEAEIRLADLRATSTTRQIELNNKLNQIRKDGLQQVAQEQLFLINRLDLTEESEQEITEILQDEFDKRDALIKNADQVFIQSANLRTNVTRQSTQDQLQLVSDLFTQTGNIFNAFGATSKELSIAQATIDTFAGANKAFALGGPLGFITGAAIIAQGLANVATIVNTDVPQFREGVINLDGPGTSTSDSIPAMLSRGESVMTAQETQDFLPTLKAMRKGDIDPQLINTVASTNAPVVIDATKTLETTGHYFNLDIDGFSHHIIGKNDSIKLKENRYRARVFK